MRCCLVLMTVLAFASRGCAGRLHGPSAGLGKDKMRLMFRDFMKTYNKTYQDQEEEKRRFEIFVENMEEVRMLQEAEEGTARYGVTKFSDLSAEELSLRSSKAFVQSICESVSLPNNEKPLPELKDWRKKNVTPVKDQREGDCRSCWAFSVVGNVESQWSIRMKELISLSEQELLDCGNKNNSCENGYIDMAFQDVKRFGLVKEADYPYKGRVSDCRRDQKKAVVKIQNCIQLPEDERAMEQYVAFNGTITVLVTLSSVQHYKVGIINSCPKKDNAMHAMLIVGYGIENSIPYWILKNSWGANWGEKGYVRIQRGNNVCEINKYAMSSVV